MHSDTEARETQRGEEEEKELPFEDEIPPYDYEPVPDSLNRLCGLVISAAIEVHKELGPGHKEGAYEEALAIEFLARGINFQRQVWFDVVYKGIVVSRSRLDFLVEGELIVDIKSCDALTARDKAQAIGYLRCVKKHIALFINFNCAILKSGIMRVIL